MVQSPHPVHANKKKRIVLSRSKLLMQVSSLRDNNKLLAKAVADKALKISQLENTGLAYENLKLQSRESVKSFQDYVFNLEGLIKKAISELAELMQRFSAILSSTREEKEKVQYLSTLIGEKHIPSSPEKYIIRGSLVAQPQTNSSSNVRKYQSYEKRVHPMNLKKSVCIMETLQERNDFVIENILSQNNKAMDKKQSQGSTEHRVKNIKTEICDEEISDEPVIQGKINASSQTTNIDDSKSMLVQNVALETQIKQEFITSSKSNTKQDFTSASESSVKITKWSRDNMRNTHSPRKLRPRKSINYADILNYRYRNGGSRNSYDNFNEDLEERECSLKIRKKTAPEKISKRNSRKISTTSLSQHQIKLEPLDLLSPEKALEAKSLEENLKIKRLLPRLPRLRDSKGSAQSKQNSKKSSNNSRLEVNMKKVSGHSICHDSNLFQSRTPESIKTFIHLFNGGKGTKECFKDGLQENVLVRDSKSFPYHLPQMTIEETFSAIKQEIINVKK